MDPEQYLRRLGLDPDTVTTTDLETLDRLQRTHVRTVPFENLAIVGVPGTDFEGAGVTLSLPRLYEKVVRRERGGYCYELNGVYHWLLAELGYTVDRAAARVKNDAGDASPASHHTNVVSLGRRYVTDVGTGVPKPRVAVPMDGSVRTDGRGVDWRVTDCDRPDIPYQLEYREPGADAWTRRYVFDDRPRELGFFEATCEYLATAPESPFTGDPVVSIATESGYRELTGGTLTAVGADGRRERDTDPDSLPRVLDEAFGLAVR